MRRRRLAHTSVSLRVKQDKIHFDRFDFVLRRSRRSARRFIAKCGWIFCQRFLEDVYVIGVLLPCEQNQTISVNERSPALRLQNTRIPSRSLRRIQHVVAGSKWNAARRRSAALLQRVRSRQALSNRSQMMEVFVHQQAFAPRHFAL